MSPYTPLGRGDEGQRNVMIRLRSAVAWTPSSQLSAAEMLKLIAL